MTVSKIYICFGMLSMFLFVQIAFGKDLPAGFDKCKRDENFDKCLVDAVNNALVLLKDGNTEFGVPRLDPLSVKSLTVESGTGPINLKQTLKNMQVKDMIRTSKVMRYRTDLNKYLIVCDSFTDRIEMNADYVMSGRILVLPITGSGRANMTLVNTKIEHKLIGEPYEKDGVKYMKLKDYRVQFEPKKVHMHFENLFNDKLLSENMNRFLNENWEIVFNELKIGYMKTFGKIFRDISNKIFTKVPFDSIFIS